MDFYILFSISLSYMYATAPPLVFFVFRKLRYFFGGIMPFPNNPDKMGPAIRAIVPKTGRKPPRRRLLPRRRLPHLRLTISD